MKYHYLLTFLLFIIFNCCKDKKFETNSKIVADPDLVYKIVNPQSNDDYPTIIMEKYHRVVPNKAMELANFIAKYRNEIYAAELIYNANGWHIIDTTNKLSSTTFTLQEGEPHLFYEKNDGISTIPVRLVKQFLE
jgi:hypothetical protein